MKENKKRCSTCKEHKELSKFYKSKYITDGYENRCKSCTIEYSTTYQKENREKTNDNRRENYHAGYKDIAAKKQREYYHKNKKAIAIRQRVQHLKRKYNLSEEDYTNMLKSQNGVCFICKKVGNNYGRLNVDHNHATGVVRGLLCNICNSFLGRIDESSEALIRANTYLQGNFDDA